MARPYIELEPFQNIKLALLDRPREYAATLVDRNSETLVVRVPSALLAVPAPERIRLVVGYRNHNWHAETAVDAHYDEWWFLHRPRDEDFESAQRREHVRIIFREDLLAIPCDHRGGPSGDPCELKVRNLSASGCYGYVKRHLENGDRLMVIISLPDMPLLQPIARVVRVQKRVQEGGAWYGFRFENLSAELEERLARHIHAQIGAQLKEGVDITAD